MSLPFLSYVIPTYVTIPVLPSFYCESPLRVYLLILSFFPQSVPLLLNIWLPHNDQGHPPFIMHYLIGQKVVLRREAKRS